MAKRLRLRISRVIPSFRSCRSKDDAAASAAGSPVFHVSPATPGASTSTLMEAAACPAELRRRGVIPVVPTPAGYSCESEGLAEDPPPAYLWRKEEKWHVVARISPPSPRRKIDSDGAGARELFPPLPVQRRSRRTEAAGKKKKKKGAKPSRSRPRVSTSSADGHWFSSEDDEEYMDDYDYGDETEVLMSSSRSFSTYSSSSPEQNPRLKPIRESPTDHHHHRAAARRGPSKAKSPSPEEFSSPAARRRSSSTSVSSVLRKLMTTPLCGAAVEGKVKDSFAVVKRSVNPYNDFRRSMVEMVVENHMYEEGDLEQLLHCFLLLNSQHHHPAIVRAFSDVWATLFPFSHSCTSAVGTPPPAAVIS